MKLNKLGGGNRIQYLDCMRGLAMLFVVNNHICQFGLDLWWNDSVIMQITGAVQLPLFFFISGLLAYKGLEGLKIEHLSLWGKGRMLLLPAILFSILFPILYLGKHLQEIPQYLYWKFPSRYWFTVSLFEMFTIYYGILLLCKILRKDWALVLITVCAIALYAVKGRFAGMWIGDKLEIPNTGIYLLYFAMGLWARKYFQEFIRLISHSRVQAICIISGAAAIWAYYGNAPHMPKLVLSTCYYFAGMPLMLIIFNLFHRSASYWASDNKIARIGNLIGRRTLDIYMIHYLFIPIALAVGPMVAERRMMAIQLIVMAVLTGVNIALTLGTSYVLRSSHFLTKYLLGGRVESRKPAAVPQPQ